MFQQQGERTRGQPAGRGELRQGAGPRGQGGGQNLTGSGKERDNKKMNYTVCDCGIQNHG